jgi:hypothetical protein
MARASHPSGPGDCDPETLFSGIRGLGSGFAYLLLPLNFKDLFQSVFGSSFLARNFLDIAGIRPRRISPPQENLCLGLIACVNAL